MSTLAATWRSNLIHRLRHLPRRCYSSTLSYQTDPAVLKRFEENMERIKLPETAQDWRTAFPAPLAIRHRVSLRNEEVAAQVAEAFVPPGSKDKVIIEAFPGPGTLTRALLDLPKDRIRKIIVLEDWESYLEYLMPLQRLDPRVVVVPQTGHAWATYTELKETGQIDVPALPWSSGVHPNLHFISHIPSTVIGEQLVAQLFRTIPDQQWLFSYGRMPMSFVMAENMYARIVARGRDKARCKVSVVAEATAETKEALPYDTLQPFDDNFHPTRVTAFTDLRRKTRAVGNPFTAVNVLPYENQVIQKGQMDAWDFILRRMFVRKASKIEECIPSIAPGARTLLKMVTDPSLPEAQRLDVRRPVRMMSPSEWAILAKAFNEWPFAPEDLGLSDGFEIREN